MGRISQVESRLTEAQELVLVQKGRAGLYAELVKTRKSVPDFSPSGTTDKLGAPVSAPVASC